MRKYFWIYFLSAGLLLLQYLYGNAISLFLTVVLIAIIVYFGTQVWLTKFITDLLQNNEEQNPQFILATKRVKDKYDIVFPALLLSAVFIGSIWCMHKITNPSGANPWFSNNQYHAIYHQGLAFNEQLQMQIENKESDNFYQVQFKNENNQLHCVLQNVFTPLYVKKDKAYVVANNIFPTEIKSNFEIRNGNSNLKIKFEEGSKNWKSYFKKSAQKQKVTVELSTSDSVFVDNASEKGIVRFESAPLQEGMTLYNFLLEQENEIAQGDKVYELLESMLKDMGETFLLHNKNSQGESYYTLFPSKLFIDKGYKLYINGTAAEAKYFSDVPLNENQNFYFGFHHREHALHLAAIDKNLSEISSKKFALYFENPSYYTLNNPNPDVIGNKSFRFLTNNLEQLINNQYNEGFYFHNYDLQFPYPLDALLQFKSNKPSQALQFELTNHQQAQHDIAVKNNAFCIPAATAEYLFGIRDFSKNGFSFSYIFLYASLVYLFFLFILIFFRGKKLIRIEPVIFTIIYTMFVLRWILSWRIATFPPLENISQFELEETLINFDFKFFGLPLPIPFSLILLFLLGFLLILYRRNNQVFSNIKLPTTFLQWPIVKQHAWATAFCLFIFIVNKLTFKVEVLFRITSIIFPILFYLYYSVKANKIFTEARPPQYNFKQKIFNSLRNYLYYFYNNPTFYLSFITFVSLAITDKGFAVLFALFILLKNILLHFLKNSFSSKNTKLSAMIWQPDNYWFYGFVSFIAYLIVIGIKPAFYYALLYKVALLFMIFSFFAIAYALLYPNEKRKKILFSIPAILFLLILAIPVLRQEANTILDKPVRHVKARASIISQSIGELLSQNEYSSYQNQKVIASAESQWFINSYITKKHDKNRTIDLQPHTKVGVNYSTQTRDVVIARYVIGEWGNFTTYIILLLFALPLILYLLSYEIKKEKGIFHSGSYAGLIPFLLIFTLAIFVWLTATNRFVFFGQDFPFLSITSRVSVLLPLLLFFTALIVEPKELKAAHLDVKAGLFRYSFIFVPVALVSALTTIRSNDLQSKNFNVLSSSAQKAIEHDFNAVLDQVQNEKGAKIKNFENLVQAVKAHKMYKEMISDSLPDAYTKSIFKQWEQQPSMAMKLNSPLFIIKDGNEFRAEYNKNLYLQLPVSDNKKVWNGTVVEKQIDNKNQVLFQYNNETKLMQLPAFIPNTENGFHIMLCPQQWFVNANSHIGLIDAKNMYGNKALIYVYKFKSRNSKQSATSFTNAFSEKDMVLAEAGKKNWLFGFKNSGNIYAENKWVNGKYRLIFPMREKNFWIYHYAHALRSVYTTDTLLYKNEAISLDYRLEQKVHDIIKNVYGNGVYQRGNKFKYSVIAADGNGEIYLMQERINNRKIIDPNDMQAIYDLQQKHFFFSNKRNERDQWGNVNLLSMNLGPGSSIKPLIYGAVASQLNAGWENLFYIPEGGDKKSYAGFSLLKDWKNDDHFHGASMNAVSYLESSSNFYHSIIMFLSAYEKSAFEKNGQYALQNLLEQNAERKNIFPKLQMQGISYRLPSYNGKKSNWPRSREIDVDNKYFSNENSLLSNGLEWNANLRINDKDKNDNMPTSSAHEPFSDSLLYSLLDKKSSSAYLWSFPEVSYFLQSQRAFSEIHQNINLGLKTPTLGGYPYTISPYKMLEMYGSLFSQNRLFALSISSNKNKHQDWRIDDTWKDKNQYYQFLASQVFTGMKQVVFGSSGTAGKLNGIQGNYFIYAKTGTINEEQSGKKSSRRLMVVISDKDLTKAENIGKAKLFYWYFTIENTGDFSPLWSVEKLIIAETMQTDRFKNYFNTNHE